MNERQSTKNLSVSIIVPARNEEKNISNIIYSIEKTFSTKSRRDFEIIIVNDNSDDETGEIAEKLGKKYSNINVVHRTEKPGFGRALKAGFKSASKRVVIPMMGDNCDDPEEALKMLEEIEKGYDFIIGTRYKSGTVAGMSIVKRIASQGFTLFGNFLGVPISDLCNAFKAYRQYVIRQVNPKSDGFQILVELPLTAYFLGYRFNEIPVSWKTRRQSRKRSVLQRGPKYLKKFLHIAAAFKFRRV